jgi:hypothetical protein
VGLALRRALKTTSGVCRPVFVIAYTAKGAVRAVVVVVLAEGVELHL